MTNVPMIPRGISRAAVEQRIATFRNTLVTEESAKVVADSIIAGDPFIFSDDRKVYDLLVNEIAATLGVARSSIVTVGSAKLGFSVHPDKFPRPFGPRSDIDIAVMDHDLFDRIWHAIVDWHYPRKGQNLPREDREWVRKRRSDIYWGLFHPDKIRYSGLEFTRALVPLRDISTLWFNTFQKASLLTGLTAHTVSGRLYRSRDHALKYQAAGLRRIRARFA